MDDEQLANEIQAVYEKSETPPGLSGRVHQRVLLVSVIRAIVRLYASAIALIGGSVLELMGGRDGASDPDDEAGKE